MSAFKSVQNKLFGKFVSYSLVPSFVLFTTKITSMLVLAKIYNIGYTKTAQGIYFSNFENFIFVNNVSNLITFIVMFSFCTLLLVKAYFFHTSHITPKFSAWLNIQNLEHLMVGSIDLYLKTISWFFFMWLTVVLMFGHAAIGIATFNYFVIAFIVALTASVFLIVDIERDHSIIKELKRLSF